MPVIPKNGLVRVRTGRWGSVYYQVGHVAPENEEIVYFLQCGKGGPVKIGTTGDGWGRIKDLSTAMPYRAHRVSVVWGGRVLERHLHHRFRKLRLNGEWFKPEGELKTLLRKLPRSMPREPATHTLNVLGERVAVIPMKQPT